MDRTKLAAVMDRARAMAADCRLCPRDCRVNRLAGDTGYCGAGAKAAMFMTYANWGEDSEIAPTQAVYLTGCNLACSFCQTGEERRSRARVELTPERFNDIAAGSALSGVNTISFLGGEPTVNLPALFELLAAANDVPPVVWNTNFYGAAEAFELLDGIADVVLGDLKFGNAECGRRLADAPDAREVARARAAEAFVRSPKALIVRHLAVPGHFDCCTRPTLEWIARNLPGVRVSLRTEYMPPRGMPAGYPESRLPSPDEGRAALGLAMKLGLALTRRPTQSPKPNGGGGAKGDGVIMEVMIAPDGSVHLRHVVREAAELLRSLSEAE